MTLNVEVTDYATTDDGAIVDVKVTTLSIIPDEWKEIRARAKALVSTGFASSASGVLEDVELGEVDRLTQTLTKEVVDDTKTIYTVKVDVPMN